MKSIGVSEGGKYLPTDIVVRSFDLMEDNAFDHLLGNTGVRGEFRMLTHSNSNGILGILQATSRMACPALGRCLNLGGGSKVKILQIVALRRDPVSSVWQSECRPQKVHVRTQTSVT